MKEKLFVLTIFLLGIIQVNSQETKGYQFTTAEGDSIKNFIVDLPASWYLTNETKGTPYVAIGIQPPGEGTLELTQCSPELRIGIQIFQKCFNETLLELGLKKTDDSIYMFQDTDNYLNIVMLFDLNATYVKGVSFSIEKLTNCLTNPDGKKKKKKRETKKSEFILFSYHNTTICIESLNGGFDNKILELIKSTFKINI